MRSVFLLRSVSLALLAATVPLSAQAPWSAAADTAWASLTTLTKDAGKSPKTPGPVTAAVQKSEREVRSSKFRQIAQSAKDFATKYPEHVKAAEAKKIEALAGLEGILLEDTVHEQSAVAVAAAFRANKSNPATARFEVALAMDGREISKKVIGRPWHAHAPMAELMMDKLRAEFGDRPEVYGAYLSLAENGDCDNGRDVAIKIMQSPALPSVKAEAKRLLDRYALIRKPLDFPLTTTQGRATTLAKEAGKITLVVFYDGTRWPGGPPGLEDYKKNPHPNTSWIYVALGAPPASPKATLPSQTPPGLSCVEPLGRKSPLFSQLKLTQLPVVFAVDGNKRLSAYGRIDQIPWLISGIGRPALP